MIKKIGPQVGVDRLMLAVVPGGVSGRLFDPHLNDQLPLWLSGEVNYWWFSDQAIAADTEKEMNFKS